MRPRAPQRPTPSAPSYGLLFSAGEGGEVLGVARKTPDHPGALFGGERPVELHDEPPQVLVPAPVLADELLVPPQLRLLEGLGESPAELRSAATAHQRRHGLLLPAPPVLEAQENVALVGEREALDARLLARRQPAREIAKVTEHPLRLSPPALRVVRGEELPGVFLVVLGELALERGKLRARQRHEHRRRVLGRLRREPAIARPHVREAPRDVLRGDAPGRPGARAPQERGVHGKLARAVPLVESGDALPEILRLRVVELE